MEKEYSRFVGVGFGNGINQDRVLAILSPEPLPTRRMINEARNNQKLLDSTCGRKTRSVIILDSGHVILCALQCETVTGRLNGNTSEQQDEVESEFEE